MDFKSINKTDGINNTTSSPSILTFVKQQRLSTGQQSSKMSSMDVNKMYPVHKTFEKTVAKELFFTDLNTTATCLICGHKVLYREFNMKRHYTAKHAKQYQKYTGETRKVVSDELLADFVKQLPEGPDLKRELQPEQNAPGIFFKSYM